jgi:hypothetical protein
LEYVNNQTEEVQQNYESNSDARKTSPMFYVCKLAVQQNGLILEHVNDLTEEIIEIALRKN